MKLAAASLEDAPRAVPPALCALIETVGTGEFRRQLFLSVERMIGAGAAAVYAASPAGLRPVLGDWQDGGGRLERHTGEFAARYSAQDPAYRAFDALVLQRGRGACLTAAVAREELPHPGHRTLMAEAGFSDRIVALFPARASGCFSLHVLRRRSDGPITHAALERFSAAAPVLGRLIGRHLSLAAPMEARLRAHAPALAPREVAVCLALLRGRSAPDIAADLGIEASSVRTYRKRAYRKLGVASLPALFQLLLNGDESWTSEATRNATTPA